MSAPHKESVLPPLVSIVIPACNAERTLAETLTSAAAQTIRDLEIIVIDDGSTDNTRAIAQQAATSDQRIHVLGQPNGGVAAARNHGLRVARGRYVAFLDADDVWHPAHLEWLHDRLTETGARLAFSGFRRIDAAGRIIGDAPMPAIEGHGLARMFYRNMVGNGSALLAERTLALSVGGFETGLKRGGAEGSEDYLFQLRCAARAPIVSVQAATVGYRWSSGSMSTDEARMSRSLRMTLATITAECGRNPRLRRIYGWRLARDDIRLASYWLAHRRKVRGLWHMLHAGMRDPIAGYAAIADRLGGRTSLPEVSLVPFHSSDPWSPPSPIAKNRTSRLHERRWRWVEAEDLGSGSI